MKVIYEAVHTEKYTDKETNEERKKYTRLGVVLEREDGTKVFRFLDTWINLYPPKMKEEGYQKAKEAVQAVDIDDSIPFMRLLDDQF